MTQYAAHGSQSQYSYYRNQKPPNREHFDGIVPKDSINVVNKETDGDQPAPWFEYARSIELFVHALVFGARAHGLQHHETFAVRVLLDLFFVYIHDLTAIGCLAPGVDFADTGQISMNEKHVVCDVANDEVVIRRPLRVNRLFGSCLGFFAGHLSSSFKRMKVLELCLSSIE